MRNRLVVFIISLFIVNYIGGQNPINGFLGIELGQKSYVAIDILKKRYPKLEWKYPSIYIKDITFVGTTFNNLIVSFKEEKLVEATFTLSEQKYAAENPFRDNSNIQLEMNNKQNYLVQKFSRIFNDLNDSFCSKYGNPAASNSGYMVWRDHNFNSIILNFTINNNYSSSSGLYTSTGKITVTYRKGNNEEF